MKLLATYLLGVNTAMLVVCALYGSLVGVGINVVSIAINGTAFAIATLKEVDDAY